MNRNDNLTTSPPSKCGKHSETPVKSIICDLSETLPYSVTASDIQPDLSKLASEMTISDDEEQEFSQTEKDTLSIRIGKFPRVALWIKEQRKIDVWLKFFQLVEDGIFPPKNIAYQLWLDVVDYIATDDVHVKRYNEDVRSFWALGYKLFRGKCYSFHFFFYKLERSLQQKTTM